MKKFVLISIIVVILIFTLKILLFADDTLNKNWFALYNQRVIDICDTYLYENNKNVQIKKITETEKFKKIKVWTWTKNEDEIDWNEAFKIAKEIYENNMNNIYKCWILIAQKSNLDLINKDILKLSNNPDLVKEMWTKLDNIIKKNEISIAKINCKPISNNNDWIQKLSILKQTTYELCRYNAYLEYLKEYNPVYEGIFIDNNKTDYNSMYLVNLEQDRKNKIDIEIKNIYKVFPIAFDSYKQYEDNLSIHLLLGLIKDDYKVLRDTMYKVLNPINQVGYKISNAMKE